MLTRAGESTSLDLDLDIDKFVKSQFGSTKYEVARPEDFKCQNTFFLKEHFDIAEGLPREQIVLPAPEPVVPLPLEVKKRATPPERQLAEFPPFSALAPAGFTCASLVTITVRAPDALAFTNKRVELQKLVGGLRAILGFECPKTAITDLVVIGTAGGREVYLGTASASENWVLAQLLPEAAPSVPAEQPAPALASRSTTEQIPEANRMALAPAGPDASATAPTNPRAQAAALIQAAGEGDLQKVRELLAKGADVNAKRDDGETALLAATRRGDARVVQELLAKGADAKVRDNLGDTALNIASDKRNQNIVELLTSSPIVSGMTIEEVLSARGNPVRKEIIPPDMELWHYPAGDVAFQNGKVSYVELK
jgi:hypothetical protein